MHLSSVMRSCAVQLHLTQNFNHSLICPAYSHCIHYLPTSYLVALLVIRSTAMVLQCLCSITLILHNNGH